MKFEKNTLFSVIFIKIFKKSMDYFGKLCENREDRQTKETDTISGYCEKLSADLLQSNRL